MGFRSINEMIGRVDRLEARKAVDHWKAKGLISPISFSPRWWGRRWVGTPNGSRTTGWTSPSIGRVLLDLCKPALERGENVEATVPIRNRDRVVGTKVGSELTRRYGAKACRTTPSN
jgi:hypothetical protein